MMEQDYLASLLPRRTPFLEELRAACAREESYAPIVTRDTEQLLVTLLALVRPRRVLEVGTAVGYSAILMAQHTPPDCEILTIERYERHAALAVDNVFRVGLESKIKVIEGEAAEVLGWLDGHFDFIFLDAAKGQYLDFLPPLLALLSPGGVLVSDNILYKGMTADEEKVERRKITIVKRLRQYLDTICSHEELETTILQIGDGVAVSVKKQGEEAAR